MITYDRPSDSVVPCTVEGDKGSSQAKKQLEKAQKQFDSLLKKQDQLLRG